MAIAYLLEFEGGTAEQYDAIMQELDLGGHPYRGGIFHVAGPIEGGWRVVDVWESEEAFNKFFEAKLGRALQNAGMGQPNVSAWLVHNTLSG
jgi:hypothetical protein